MRRTRYQQLLDELEGWRRRATGVILGAAVPAEERPLGLAPGTGAEPHETISGTVAGGPTLRVENRSAAHLSTGIDVQVGADDPANATEGRTFGLSATVDQQEGVGVIGRGDYGVVGQSPDNVGVMGFGTTGVFGFSNDPKGCGIEGRTASLSGVGVLASAPEPAMTALAIDTGAVRVVGAGEQSATPVFIHVTNEANTRGSQTIIDHPMTNGDPHAILLVTRRESRQVPDDSRNASSPGIEPWSVAFNIRADKWMIMQSAGTRLPAGTAFNILVVKP